MGVNAVKAKFMKAHRVEWIDNIRVFSILWVICYAHMDDYTNLNFTNAIAPFLSNGFLSSMTFISGLLISKYEFNSKSQIAFFAKKRVLRLFPLCVVSAFFMYRLSLASLQLTYVKSVKQLVYTLSCLSMFFKPRSMRTLWYVSMLFVLMAFTPFLLWRYDVKKFVLQSAALLVVLIVLWRVNYVFNIDERLIYYYPFYVFGLFAGKKGIEFRKGKWKELIVSLSFAALLCFMLVAHENMAYYHFKYLITFVLIWVFCFFFLLSAIQLSQWVPNKINKLFSFIAYGSMCLYLLHRQFYAIVWVNTGDIPIWIAYCVLLPALMVICYLIQYLYDMSIKAMARFDMKP